MPLLKIRGLMALAALAAVCLIGCSTRYASSPGMTPAVASLEAGQKAYIAGAADGSYGAKVYPGSGLKTSQLLQKAVSAQGSPAIMGGGRQSVEVALESAQAAGCRYMFYPQLTLWEPRAAAWSGRATKVELIVYVYDLSHSAADQLIKQQYLGGKGRNVTLISQDPEDILENLLAQFAKEAYGRRI